MGIEIKHSGGVGGNSSYAILIDGERRGSIEMKNRMWAVLDAYQYTIRTKLRSKQEAVDLVASGEIILPTVGKAYQDAWKRVYENRKAQAQKYLAAKMAQILDQITMDAPGAKLAAEKMTETIESAARGETDLEYPYQNGEMTFHHHPITGSFPQKPPKKDEAA